MDITYLLSVKLAKHSYGSQVILFNEVFGE